MNVTIDLTKLKKAVTEIAGVAAMVVPAIESIPLPTAVRPVLAAAGAAILAISHWVTANIASGTSTTTATAAKTASSPTATATTSGPPAVA